LLLIFISRCEVRVSLEAVKLTVSLAKKLTGLFIYKTRGNFLPARHYASAVLAMALCPSVCLSVCHKPVFYGKGCADQAGFGTQSTLGLSYTQCCK